MPTLTITSENEAEITINGNAQSSMTVEEGTPVEWKVSLKGKGTRSGSLVLNEDVTLDVKFVVGSFNINFLTNEAFDAMGTPEPNGIYAVECDPVVEYFPTREDIATGVADGTSWYRLHKSGWLEQGGVYFNNVGNTLKTVVLSLPFINNNYTILASCNLSTSTGNCDWSNVGIRTKETDYFTAYTNANVPCKDWVAKGYIGDIPLSEDEEPMTLRQYALLASQANSTGKVIQVVNNKAMLSDPIMPKTMELEPDEQVMTMGDVYGTHESS